MKNFKNFAIYGLPVCSLSNMCAMDLDGLLYKLTDVLANNNKKAGLELLNKQIFNKSENDNKLVTVGDIFLFSTTKEINKQANTLFILFHGLGQSVNEYIDDIGNLEDKFNADVLFIEYNLNGNKTNTFEDIEEYCKKVAESISALKYKNNIFFGYSLGSFVANLVRKYFNEINKGEIDSNEITSKYIGYKGIKDLDDAGSSFIKTFTGKYIDKKDALQILNNKVLIKIGASFDALNKCDFNTVTGVIADVLDDLVDNDKDENNNIKFESYSDVFMYLLGEAEFKKFKELTTNASILENTYGFDKEKVVFNDNLVTKDHKISLEDDIATISKALEENNDKDVFLFQCKNGDEVVGKAMEDIYKSLTGEEKGDKELDYKGEVEENKDKQGDDIHKPDYKWKVEDNKNKQGDDIHKPDYKGKVEENKDKQGDGIHKPEEQLPKQQKAPVQKQDNEEDDSKSSSCCGIF